MITLDNSLEEKKNYPVDVELEKENPIKDTEWLKMLLRIVK